MMSESQSFLSGVQKNTRFGISRVGIGGFTFYTNVREVPTYQNNVPDTFLEDGSSVSQNIINAPIQLEITGVVGDLFLDYSSKPEIRRVVSATPANITSYEQGQLTVAQQQQRAQVIDDSESRYSSIDESGQQPAAILGGQLSRSNQEKFISTIESYFFGKNLISVDVGTRQYENMAIVSCALPRDSVSDSIEFSLTLKQVRVVSAQALRIPKGLKNTASPAINGQAEELAEKGAQTGKETTNQEKSLLTQIFEAF